MGQWTANNKEGEKELELHNQHVLGTPLTCLLADFLGKALSNVHNTVKNHVMMWNIESAQNVSWT